MNNIDLFVRPLIDRLTDLLKKSGYGDPGSSKYEGKTSVKWMRDRNGILNKVKLVFANRNPTSLSLGLSISVRIGEDEVILTGTDVNKLRRSRVFYDVPFLFGKLRATSFVEGIIEDLKESLSWFEEYSDKRKCLEMVRSGEAGISPKGTLYEEILKKLGG